MTDSDLDEQWHRVDSAAAEATRYAIEKMRALIETYDSLFDEAEQRSSLFRELDGSIKPDARHHLRESALAATTDLAQFLEDFERSVRNCRLPNNAMKKWGVPDRIAGFPSRDRSLRRLLIRAHRTCGYLIVAEHSARARANPERRQYDHEEFASVERDLRFLIRELQKVLNVPEREPEGTLQAWIRDETVARAFDSTLDSIGGLSWSRWGGTNAALAVMISTIGNFGEELSPAKIVGLLGSAASRAAL